MTLQIEPTQPVLPGRMTYFAAGVLLVALYIALTLSTSFLCDDAFITFRYAQNLAGGHGPVFNQGERVEGYTSYLWMILMAAVIRLGGVPEFWSRFLSLLFGIGSIILLIRWVTIRLGRSAQALAPVALLVLCAPFVVWSSGGLETTTAAFLVLASLILLFRFHDTRDLRRLVGASSVMAAAVLTRPETILIAAVSTGYILVMILRRIWPRRAFAIYILPAALIVGTHLVWRWSYYGKLAPATFYVKRPGFDLILYGAKYLGRFGLESGLWLPIGAVFLLLWRSGAGRMSARTIFLLAAILLFLVWIVYSGGDFMVMGRFFVPVVPAIVLLIAELCHEAWPSIRGTRRKAALFTIVVLYAAGNFYALYDSQRSYSTGTLDSIGQLKEYRKEWTEAAMLVREVAQPTDTIAVSAVGIIPYLTHLPTLDILGIIAPDLDKYERRQATRRPGHWLSISPKYFFSLRPQFFLGHPHLSGKDQARFFWGTMEDYKQTVLQYYLPVSIPIPGSRDQHLFFFMRRDIVPRYPGRLFVYELQL